MAKLTKNANKLKKTQIVQINPKKGKNAKKSICMKWTPLIITKTTLNSPPVFLSSRLLLLNPHGNHLRNHIHRTAMILIIIFFWSFQSSMDVNFMHRNKQIKILP